MNIHKILLDEHFVAFFQGLPNAFQQAVLYTLDWIKSGDGFPPHLIKKPDASGPIWELQVPAQPHDILLISHFISQYGLLYISNAMLASVSEANRSPFYEEGLFLFEDFYQKHF